MITRTTDEGITVICSDENKWLVKGESFSNTEIFLGKNDKVDNWTEMDREPQEIIIENRIN